MSKSNTTVAPVKRDTTAIISGVALAVGIGIGALLTIALYYGRHCEGCEDRTLAYDYAVKSDRVLNGHIDVIYPNRDLADQGCHVSTIMPRKILCQRERTIVFDDPQESRPIPEWQKSVMRP